ncbi:hypothetical protein [Micromonospora sp. NPDC049240]|uniref:hypothetical protein n=1 Tax=Micromonospora sp. NPDC049240 TaxID=3155151 RepID=UPI00340C259C
MDSKLHALRGTATKPQKTEHASQTAVRFLLAPADGSTPEPVLVIGSLFDRFRPAVAASPQQTWTVAGRWETQATQSDDGTRTTTRVLVAQHIIELDGWTLWEARQFHPANVAHLANPGGDPPIGVITEAELEIEPDTCTVQPTGKIRHRVAFCTPSGAVTTEPTGSVYLQAQPTHVTVQHDC